jgi:hypothetical protein
MGCTRYPGLRRASLSMLGLLMAAGLMLFDLSRAGAADVETRTYIVAVDGTKSGDYQLVIQRQDDGTVTVSAQSNVRVTLLAIPVYTYNYSATEVWLNGRLQHFQGSGKEKGKEFAVRADLDGTTIRVQAMGKEHRTQPDIWLTSCWQLPEAKYRNNNVMLLGCDTGNDIASRLQYIGNDQLNVAGQTQTCSHYRVMKDVLHDVWYDAQERLVRDEWVSSGHRTTVEMTGRR